MSLSCTVPEILSLISQNFNLKTSRDRDYAHSKTVSNLNANPHMAN